MSDRPVRYGMIVLDAAPVIVRARGAPVYFVSPEETMQVRGCGRVQQGNRGEAMSTSTLTGDKQSSGARKGRVLVIDNDRDIAEIVYALLTDEGYAVSYWQPWNPTRFGWQSGSSNPIAFYWTARVLAPTDSHGSRPRG